MSAKAHSILPTSTIKDQVGNRRWRSLLDHIESKYGTRTIILGYHQRGVGGHVYLTNERGKCVGPLADILAASDRKVECEDSEEEKETESDHAGKATKIAQRLSLSSKRVKRPHD